MKIQNIILFIGLGLITASCGVGKKDGRVVLHSESEEAFLVGDHWLSKRKLGTAIASQLTSVAVVFHINTDSNVQEADEIVFSVRTTSGKIYTGLRCAVDYGDFVNQIGYDIRYVDCGNDKVRFSKTISVALIEVTADRIVID